MIRASNWDSGGRMGKCKNHNFFWEKKMRNYTAIFLIFTAFCISAFAVSGRMPKVQSANFSEVEISLDENFTLANALALPRAPGSQVQVLDDGRKVKTQLPQRTLRGLIDTGADVNVTRNFILMQAAANDTESDEITPADSSPAYGEKDDNITIPYNDWAYSDISFYSYPSELLVTTVDVHYRVYGSSGYMYLDFGDEDFDVFTYVLLDYEYSYRYGNRNNRLFRQACKPVLDTLGIRAVWGWFRMD